MNTVSSKPVDTKDLQNEYLANLASMFMDTLVKPTIGKDTRSKDLEPLPQVVWKNGELVELDKILPVTRSG